MKWINQDDLLNLSCLFVPKLDLATKTDNVRTQLLRRENVRTTSIIGALVNDDRADILAKRLASIAIGGLISSILSRCIFLLPSVLERLKLAFRLACF